MLTGPSNRGRAVEGVAVARRRRAVERATFRRTVTDRVVVLVLVVVTASGLMSVLPGSSQRAVSRTACRAVSLGFGACGAAGLDLEDTALAPARCPTLARLDRWLPEVRVRRLVAAQGLPVTISTARSGDMDVQLGAADQPAPPALLAGQPRGQRPVVDGVAVPAQAEWYLPRGQGLDELVIAVQDGHHRWVQQRSALAVVSRGLSRADREVPPPTLSYSRLSFGDAAWPRWPDTPAVPRTAAPAKPSRLPSGSVSGVTVDRDRPATFVFNRVTRESALVTDLYGTVGGRPVTGTLRLVRDGQGSITSLLAAVVGTGALAPGEPRTSLPGPAVAYVSVPVRTGPERALVSSWLAGGQPVRLPLDELLGLRVAAPSDRVGSFLTRAADVTLLRYSLVSPVELQARVSAELVGLRRTEWEGIQLTEVAAIAPTPTGTGRRVLADPGCRA